MTLRACLILLVTGHGARAQGRQEAPGLTRGPSGSESATHVLRASGDATPISRTTSARTSATSKTTGAGRAGAPAARRRPPLTAAETARWKVHEARLRANHPVACGPGKRRFLVYQYGARPRPVPANAAARVAK